MIDTYQDYLEAGFKIFGLHTVRNGICTCGNPDCKALFKHPKVRRWQLTPDWSQEQLDCMVMKGDFDTGFGVLLDKWLVIDIDPRNGGADSYEKLCADTGLDFKAESNFVVHTGGGGWHIYYTRPNGDALVSKLNDYPGIDFKSSGFVVGADSHHESGNTYEIEKGHPVDVAAPPQALIDLLKKAESHRATVNGSPVDVSDSDIAEMLGHLDPDCDYDQWIKIGMSIHHATGGAGFEQWCDWSANGSKFPGSDKLERHWHSFGKSANPATLGTLVYYAEKNGYSLPVTFEADIHVNESQDIDIKDIDLLRPPGFVGQLTAWINNQCLFPREHVAVAGALLAVGAIGGLKYTDQERKGARPNLMLFCSAGSSTGKEAIEEAVNAILVNAGMGVSVYGSIKSEQEMIRNFISNPTAIYLIDEIGLFLNKISNAKGTPYLEGIIGTMLSAFTKTNGTLKPSGDVKKQAKKEAQTELAALEKLKDENEKINEERYSELQQLVAELDEGIKRPFLSLMGFTTPQTFNSIVNSDMVSNGFIGRSIIVQEKETNPRIKKDYSPQDMTLPMQMTLKNIADGSRRGCEHVVIPSTDTAKEALLQISDELHDLAEFHKVHGLESLIRRGYEMILKISLILAIPEGLRTREHVLWAYAYVKRDQDGKINLALSNAETHKNEEGEKLLRKIIALLDHEVGLKTGTIRNNLRKYAKEDVDKGLQHLAGKGIVYSEHVKPKRGKPHDVWFLSTS